MKLSNNEKTSFFTAFRFAGYFFLTIFFVYFLRFISSIYQANTFIEFGIVENMQLGILFLTAILFTVLSVISKQYRGFLFFLSSLCLFALIRELDSLLDDVIPFISWKFCYLFPIGALIYCLKNKKQLLKNITSFIQSPTFHLMMTAMIVFIPLAQVLGNKEFISNALPNDTDLILTRRFVEESAEIIAYFLLLLSTAEFYFSLIRKK